MRKTYQNGYQITLILFSVIATVLLAAFIYREVFPEYKNYQNTYIAVENLRPGKPPKFKKGIKQVIYRTDDTGPEQIDRCTSCHVATDLSHFSPTTLERDINGQLVYDAQGIPVKAPNPHYVWDLPGAQKYRYQKINGLNVDMALVLAQHPLIGAETRPFEFHPVAEYGCTTCHSGNGRSVNARRAHGPVFDAMYEPSDHAVTSPFQEVHDHDPQIARVYNFEPDASLLFQTTPLLPGPLMEAKCAQCHQAGSGEITSIIASIDLISERKKDEIQRLQQGIEADLWAKTTLEELKHQIENQGVASVESEAKKMLQDPTLSADELDAWASRLQFLQSGDDLIPKIDQRLAKITLADKLKSLDQSQAALNSIQEATTPLTRLHATDTTVDRLLDNYTRGKDLYLTQGCYACHRIAGLSRGAIGPDLTEIGLSYPWYVKLSIVWPQGSLPTSTMPNYNLDHEEVEDLLAFLMAQRNDQKVVSNIEKNARIKAWESGKKLPWEEPIPPSDITNVRFGMTVFATQGCAACHKLQGFEGDVAFADDKELRPWFFDTFPEQISGHDLIALLQAKGKEIDAKIVKKDVKKSILEEIEAKSPGTIDSFYTSFAIARRHSTATAWQDRIDRLLTMYIQQYGLGRTICPPLNWSGVWRDDQWLTGHFLNPSAYAAKSIMPPFPFDITKFYALNHTLHVLGHKNRKSLRELWKIDGFNPELAFELQCAACHGTNRHGNGPVAEWIYPIPKNLRNSTFLRHLTREQAINSITHGVPGTPMPPWGEGDPAVMTQDEIVQLVDWLYSTLPGTNAPEQKEKWEYTQADVNQELAGVLVDGYIQEKYYTPINLAEGEALFNLNCAVCHGSDGTGAGPRAEAMYDAKPRMLTNLPWLKNRDDLRMLQSIKFGVQGTSMPAWGDQTTPLQRVQLVAYIRSLSHEKELRDALSDALYDIYDTNVLAIEKCRTNTYPAIVELEKEISATQQKLDVAQDPVKGGNLYKHLLSQKGELKKLKSRDAFLLQLIATVEEEKQLFFVLGELMIAKEIEHQVFENYLTCIRSNALTYSVAYGCVEIKTPLKSAPCEVSVAPQIAKVRHLIEVNQARLPTAEVMAAQETLDTQLDGLINLQTQLLNRFREAKRLQEKQRKIYDDYHDSL